ncbi:MAG: RagB/SusD family nutrient uptake outer membrane protein [Capnocytophaga sp.]|nr:RagB/SusD family nutrient uptake outer membrane protein [Capnocytophaga sp.]
MKKIYITLFGAMLAFSSCELDLKPESSLTYNGFWETEEAVKTAQIGIYNSFRGQANNFWLMGEMRSDIWGGKTIEDPWNAELARNNISKTNVFFGNWSGYYGTLHYINDFIKNAPGVTFRNETEKNHLLGQIHGIRAYMYYTMLKAWGEVPITTDPLETVTSLEILKKKRAPKEEVMTQIKSDLEKSLEYFGTNNALWLNKNVYWSKAATLALKGDVYLWSGKVLGGGNADFTEAKTALEAVSGFSLANYTSLWGEANEFNNEFIFAFDYQLDQAENNFGVTTARRVDIETSFDDQGNSFADFIANSHNRYGASTKTLLLIDDTDDQRRNTFIRIYSTAGNYIPFADVTEYRGSMLNKFMGTVGSDGIRRQLSNVPLYRYADVVLLLAEAKNHLGEDPSAEINSVRARAYGSNYAVATHGYTNGSQTANAKAILDERYKEFIGEGKRWWDLVRAGDTYVFDEVATMSASEAYKIYYSISESMIANDPELTQTAGY